MQDHPAQGRSQRRLLVAAALSAALLLTTGALARPPRSKEKPVSPFLTLNPLDEERFPELEREPGVYGVETWLLRPGADARVPVPKESAAALLVSYTLLLRNAPFGTRWQMEAVGPGPDGKERRLAWELNPPPLPGDNIETITPDPNLRPDPGSVDRGVFWVDLGPLVKTQALRPGDQLTLRYGGASTKLALPAALR